MCKTEKIASWNFRSLSILLWLVLCQNPITAKSPLLANDRMQMAQHDQDEMTPTKQDRDKPLQKKPALVPPVILGFQTPIITSHDQLDDHVGSLVTIRGEVFVNKTQSMPIGVQIVAPHRLNHEDGYASGILAKFVRGLEKGGAQHRGREGEVYYVLCQKTSVDLSLGAKLDSQDKPKRGTVTDWNNSKASEGETRMAKRKQGR